MLSLQQFITYNSSFSTPALVPMAVSAYECLLRQALAPWICLSVSLTLGPKVCSVPSVLLRIQEQLLIFQSVQSLVVRMKWQFPSFLYAELETRCPTNFLKLFTLRSLYIYIQLLELIQKDPMYPIPSFFNMIISWKSIIQFILVVHLLLNCSLLFFTPCEQFCFSYDVLPFVDSLPGKLGTTDQKKQSLQHHLSYFLNQLTIYMYFFM